MNFRVDGHQQIEASVIVDVIDVDVKEVSTVVLTGLRTVEILHHVGNQAAVDLKLKVRTVTSSAADVCGSER